MRYLKFIIGILIILLIFIIVFENYEAFSTKVVFRIDLFGLHFKSQETSIFLVVLISFFFGILVAGLYGIIERFQLKREIKKMRSISKEKEMELNSLRNLPITSDNVGSNNL